MSGKEISEVYEGMAAVLMVACPLVIVSASVALGLLVGAWAGFAAFAVMAAAVTLLLLVGSIKAAKDKEKEDEQR